MKPVLVKAFRHASGLYKKLSYCWEIADRTYLFFCSFKLKSAVDAFHIF